MFNKSIQSIAAVFISCIIVYGIAYAQQVCCSTIANTCISTSTVIACEYTSDHSWTTFSSRNRNTQLQPKLCWNKFSADFGSGNTCCETDHCNEYYKVTYISLSFVQDFYPLNKSTNALDAGIDSQTTFELYRLPTSFNFLPIYIIKQSFIC